MNVKINIDSIGIVNIYSSNKAKRIIIYIKKNNEIKVAVPKGISIDKVKEFIFLKANWIKDTKKKISNKISLDSNNINKKLAKKILIERLNKISIDTGLFYNKVSIRNQKTRWGSCSSLNNINLNINLIKLPLRLIDYVIFHELVHTIEKNHSRKFWNLLNKYLPEAQNLNKELNNYAL